MGRLNRRQALGGALAASTPSLDGRQRGGSVRCIVYRRILDDGSLEFCEISNVPQGYRIAGRIISAAQGAPPAFARYEMRCARDFSRCFSIQAECQVGVDVNRIALASESHGRWRINGRAARGLDGCTDPDLEWSPVSNVFPISRLPRAPGAALAVRAAWLRFPSLRVEPADQSYERVADNRARYRSRTFSAEITVDASGLPQTYAGVWTRIADWRSE